MKKIAICFAVFVFAVATVVIWCAWSSKDSLALGMGNFVVLSFTLIVLVWYAYDTNLIARVTKEHWKREGVFTTTYSMDLLGNRGDSERTMFRIHNPSTLVVRAKVACNFRLYGNIIESYPSFDGRAIWLVYPQQTSQQWFEIDSLLQKKGKSVTAMIAEITDVNRKEQLTMLLELEFWDEL